MIGINVRGFRHLWRLSDSSLKEILVNFKDYGPSFCHVLKTKEDSPIGEKLIIFNNHFNTGNLGISTIINSKVMSSDDINFVVSHYTRTIEIGKKRQFGSYSPYIYNITMLPDNFEDEYKKFLSANAKMIRTLTSKYRYNVDQDFSKRVFMYTDGSKNFYQWAISNCLQNGISLNSIRTIMLWNENYGQMAKNLRKSTITAYTSDEDIMSLSEELRLLRRDKRINDVINSFNTVQKRILRGAQLSEKDKETLSKFHRLSDTKRSNFIRKMSTIEDYDEIMRQMRHLTSIHFDWNKESFMDFISNVEGMKYELVYDNGDIVLIKVNDYETVKNLAKTTNWCISKNKTYWNQYVEQRLDSTQYIVFDFSKKEDDLLSIIGFTTEYNRGITHAHDFTNNDIMRPNDDSELAFIKSFVSKFNSSNSIYGVLKSCGIDINMVAQYDKPLFKWDKESMFTYLYECVNKNNVDVLCDNGNKVAISVKDKGVRYFLGDAYIDNICESNWGWQHIIFMDFAMNEFNPNRMQFAIIRRGDDEGEDTCHGFFNEHIEATNMSFDTKLSQYNLPYNIIRRTDNKFVRISGAFLSSNIPLFKSLIKDVNLKEIKKAIYDFIGEETAIDKISSSLISSMSFDFINAFYDNNIKLGDIFDTSYMSSLLKDVTTNMISHGKMGVMDGSYKMPTANELEEFLAGNCDDINRAYYIGSFLALKKIIVREKGFKNPNGMYRRMIATILMSRKSGEIFEDLLMDIVRQLSFKEPSDAVCNWINFVYARGSEKIKQYTIDNLLKYKYPKGIWDDIEKHKKRMEEFGPQEPTIGIGDPYLGDLPVLEDREPEEWEFLDEEDEPFEDGEIELAEDERMEEPAEAVF